MCGIIALLSKEEDVRLKILTGLRILENRGYDSAGIAILDSNNNYQLIKDVEPNAIQKVSDGSCTFKGKIGIGHTRWATHGKSDSQFNAHPHESYDKRFVVVHNGIIENYEVYKNELIKNNIEFKSDTDSEVIAHMLASCTQKSTSARMKEIFSKLYGTWGVAVLDKENPNEIYIARNGSPLLVGVNENTIYVASELSAFAHSAKKYFEVDDMSVLTLNLNMLDNSLEDIQHVYGKKIKNVVYDAIDTSPLPYPYWTIKEIVDQSRTIKTAINNGGRIPLLKSIKLGGLERHMELLTAEHLIIAACGSSYHAGLYSLPFFRKFSRFKTVQIVDAANVEENMFPRCKNPNKICMLVLSQSGETRDVIYAIDLAKRMKIQIFSIVNSVGSQISRLTGVGVYLNCGREVGVAATKSFTSQCIVLLLVSLWYSQHRIGLSFDEHDLISSIFSLPSNVETTIYYFMSGEGHSILNSIVEKLSSSKSCFILGKGYSEAIAREAALKIKELSYLHVEAYNTSSLKHGPLAVIEEGLPVFIIILNDEHIDRNISAIMEIKSRGGYVITVVESTVSINLTNIDLSVSIPSHGKLTSLLSIVIFQLISYYTALYRKYNPDKPRNLAKTVTVD